MTALTLGKIFRQDISGIRVKDEATRTVLYDQSLTPEEGKKLTTELFDTHGSIVKSFYFPTLQQAQKIQNLCLRFFACISAFFFDLIIMPIALPIRKCSYESYKKELKTQLPFYIWLKERGVPQKYLEKDSFEILIFTDKTKGAEFAPGFERVFPEKRETFKTPEFQNRVYQNYHQIRYDVYGGVEDTGSSGSFNKKTEGFAQTYCIAE